MKADAWHTQTAGSGSARSVTKRLLEQANLSLNSTQSNRTSSRVAADACASSQPQASSPSMIAAWRQALTPRAAVPRRTTNLSNRTAPTSPQHS
jgi:hypothetical protein